MAARPRRISILRPLAITVLALALAVALERFSFPSIPFISAGNSEFNVVYSELRGSESTLWLADPSNPLGKRKAILAVSHAFGYGITASVSPNGDRVAYGFLPQGRKDAFADGQLWVASIDGFQPRLVAGQMDLHFPPVWSLDGDRLLFKTVESAPAGNPPAFSPSDAGKPDQRPYDLGFRSSLVVASLDNPPALRTVVSLREADIFPIGWSPDNRDVYYYVIEAGGSRVRVVDVVTASTRDLGQLASGPVWSVRLSPDGNRLLFLTVRSGEAGTEGTPWLFDTQTGQVAAVSTPQLGPAGAIWRPSGDSITHSASTRPSAPGQLLADTTSGDGTSQILRQEADNTISLPLSWSPDAAFLALRRRSVAANDTLDNLAIFDTRSGLNKEIRGGYADFVGWTTLAR